MGPPRALLPKPSSLKPTLAVGPTSVMRKALPYLVPGSLFPGFILLYPKTASFKTPPPGSLRIHQRSLPLPSLILSALFTSPGQHSLCRIIQDTVTSPKVWFLPKQPLQRSKLARSATALQTYALFCFPHLKAV